MESKSYIFYITIKNFINWTNWINCTFFFFFDRRINCTFKNTNIVPFREIKEMLKLYFHFASSYKISSKYFFSLEHPTLSTIPLLSVFDFFLSLPSTSSSHYLSFSLRSSLCQRQSNLFSFHNPSFFLPLAFLWI